MIIVIETFLQILTVMSYLSSLTTVQTYCIITKLYYGEYLVMFKSFESPLMFYDIKR